MKKAILLLLVIVAVGLAYSPYSFRYSSTAGILWDDYDWFLNDPARIPLIEGSQLYTNLANFVSGQENAFSDSIGFQGPGFFLIGGKTFGPPLGIAGVFDTRMLHIADTIDINGTQYLGYGSEVDTNYVVDPDDGSITSSTLSTDIIEAWHSSNQFDGFFGLGYELNEGFNLGFAFDHESDNLKQLPAANNVISSNYSYTGSSLDSYDTTNSYGELVIQEMSNRVRFGAWTEMGYFQLSGYAGAEMFSGDAGRDSVNIYSLIESYGDPGSITANWATNLENWRYSGLAFPVELLGIYELSEGADLWFTGGFEYNMWSWKGGAGVNNVGNDTTLASAGGITSTNIGIDTILTAGSGKGSGMAYSLGTKGVFDLNEKISFGLGLGFRGFTEKDSTLNEHSTATYALINDGDGIDEFEDFTATTYTSSSDYVINKASTLTVYAPVGVEFKPIDPLALRLGATFTHRMNTYTTHVQGIGTIETESHTVHGDGTTIDTTYYDPYDITNDEGVQKETLNNVVYDFGIGIDITENFQIDLMGFSDLLNLGSWRISAIFKF
jgi:hypothetical protein